ncbi:MAG: ATP-binding protein [Candidatus Latescibacter sp.]|nr:ATP-binding protein [Candidatus Latescibacter sp.]
MKTCKVCGSSGIRYDRDIKAGSHGDLVICDCILKKCACGGVPPYQMFQKEGGHSWCACRSARVKLVSAKKAFKESQIPKKYQWKFFEDFKIVAPAANTLVGITSTIRETHPDTKWNNGFYLWGRAGSGKTLLAAIILQELMLKYGLAGKFVDLSRQFFQRLKNSFDTANDTGENAGEILDELIQIPFLVIDDFGVQRNTEWESEMLYNLIDSRYSDERVTIVTSNFHVSKYKEAPQGRVLSDVAQERVHSRLVEMCTIIKVDLPDYRETFTRDNSNIT